MSFALLREASCQFDWSLKHCSLFGLQQLIVWCLSMMVLTFLLLCPSVSIFIVVAVDDTVARFITGILYKTYA
jgi:hypothetical protein